MDLILVGFILQLAVFGCVLYTVMGARPVAILGGVLAASGIFIASISPSLLQFALALILLTGNDKTEFPHDESSLQYIQGIPKCPRLTWKPS